MGVAAPVGERHETLIFEKEDCAGFYSCLFFPSAMWYVSHNKVLVTFGLITKAVYSRAENMDINRIIWIPQPLPALNMYIPGVTAL